MYAIRSYYESGAGGTTSADGGDVSATGGCSCAIVGDATPELGDDKRCTNVACHGGHLDGSDATTPDS